MSIGTILFVLLLDICFAENGTRLAFTDDDLQESFGKVIYSTVLFRHGDRTPISVYPTDPYPLTIWEEGPGQLTKLGKLHEYELGKWTRQRYKDLIAGKPYKYDFILVNSSDSDRTLMSAQLFLAGMFPPSEKEAWNNENLHWQPIPVHTKPKPTDNIIALEQPCERYDLEMDLLNNSPEFDAFFSEHRAIFEYVSTHSGIPMSKDNICQAVNDFSDVHDTLFVEDQNNLTIPKWAQKIFPQPMKSVAEFFFETLVYTDEMRRLKGGPLLKSIVDDMSKKIANNLGNRSFHIYSGHDTTVAVLLDTLGIYNRLAPPYSAAVFVELREKNDDHFVSVLYRNSTQVAPFLLGIPGCKSDVCTLDEFVRTTISVIPDNWEYECQLGLLMKLYYFNYLYLVVLGLIVIVLLALLLTIGRLHFLRIRRYKHYQTIQDDILSAKTDVRVCD